MQKELQAARDGSRFLKIWKILAYFDILKEFERILLFHLMCRPLRHILVVSDIGAISHGGDSLSWLVK